MSRKVLVGAVALLTSVVTGCATGPTINDLWDQAMAVHEAKDWVNASSAWRRYIARHNEVYPGIESGTDAAYYNLALSEQARGDDQSALDAARNSFVLDPSEQKTAALVIRLANRLGQMSVAEETKRETAIADRCTKRVFAGYTPSPDTFNQADFENRYQQLTSCAANANSTIYLSKLQRSAISRAQSDARLAGNLAAARAQSNALNSALQSSAARRASTPPQAQSSTGTSGSMSSVPNSCSRKVFCCGRSKPSIFHGTLRPDGVCETEEVCNC